MKHKKKKTNVEIVEDALRRASIAGNLIGKLDFDLLAREFPCPTLTAAQPHESEYDALVEYLRQKTTARDWHAVSDAANDIRVLVARHPDLEQPVINIGIPCKEN